MIAKEISQVASAPRTNYTLIMFGVLGLVFSPALVMWLVNSLSSH